MDCSSRKSVSSRRRQKPFGRRFFRHPVLLGRIQDLCKDKPVLLSQFTRLGRPVRCQGLEDVFQLIGGEYPTLDREDCSDLLDRRRHAIYYLYRILPVQLVLLTEISG